MKGVVINLYENEISKFIDKKEFTKENLYLSAIKNFNKIKRNTFVVLRIIEPKLGLFVEDYIFTKDKIKNKLTVRDAEGSSFVIEDTTVKPLIFQNKRQKKNYELFINNIDYKGLPYIYWNFSKNKEMLIEERGEYSEEIGFVKYGTMGRV